MAGRLETWNVTSSGEKRRGRSVVIPDPPPVVTATVFGACPIGSDGQSETAASIASKWTNKATARLFFGSSLTQTAKPSSPRTLLHVSAKPATSVTDAQIDAWLNYYVGHLVTFWHESDNDTGYTGTDSTSVANRTARIALQNRLYDRNNAIGRPARVVQVFTGAFWSNNTTDTTRNLWMNTLKGDYIGIDHDGVHDLHTSPPPDGISYYANTGSQTSQSNKMTPELRLANIQRYLTSKAANGWLGFTVPEMGCQRAPWDTTGAGRVRWLQDCRNAFVNAGAVAIQYYDDRVSPRDDVLYNPSGEYTYWLGQCNSNPAWAGW